MVLLACGAAIARLPIHRWRFTAEGRQITVSNFIFHETIVVDGVRVPHTRVGGNYLTWATHALALPDGRELLINIASQDGITVRCSALIGEEVVFDSSTPVRALGRVAPTRAALPEPAATPTSAASAAPSLPAASPAPALPLPEPREARDPRWTAASVLLSSLRADPELGRAAADLEAELRRALARRAATAEAVAAHVALGGSSEELAPIVSQREQAVQDLLRVLRELHLAASRRELTASALPHVEDVLARLRASHEVDADTRRQLAARLAQKTP